MRTAWRLPAFAAASAVIATAGAQTPPNQLIAGSVSQAVGSLALRSNCYVAHAGTSFQRNGLSTKAVISFDDITQGGTDLSGQAVMTFTSATSGTIHFKQFPGLSDPAFVNYAQSYNATALKLSVSFLISFSDCSLPITAVYDLT